MKKSVLFGIASVLAAIFMAVGCEKGDQPGGDNGPGGDEPGQGTEYTLIATPTSVNFVWSSPSAQTVKVTTNAPEGFTVGEPAAWYTATKSGNDITIQPQTNDGGLRTHDLVITAPGANSVTITVSQDAKGEVHASLQGQKYIVWQLDEISGELLGDRIIMNLAENGNNQKFFIWDNTFNGEDPAGPNFYGNMGGYMALSVGNVGWTGAGYTLMDDAATTDVNEEDKLKAIWQQIIDDKGEGWYFHAAFKGTSGASNKLTLCDTKGKDPEVPLSIACDDYGIVENEWKEAEVSLEGIVEKGWTGASNSNNLIVQSSNKEGDKFHYDAVFIYKK